MEHHKEKITVGLCVVLNNDNYGSMLQSFATQRILEKYGISYELIRYKREKSLLTIVKSLPRLLNSVMLQDKYLKLKKKVYLKTHKELIPAVAKRKAAYAKFRENNFTAPSPLFSSYKELKASSLKYDIVMVGSDQLWSPSGLPTNFYNLMFVDDSIKKISYASSFGVDKIPFYQINRTKKYLKRIESIGVRENSGRVIIKDLIDRDVPVVCDPTMLFTGEEWTKMLPCERVCSDKYIFSYLLSNDGSTREEVLKLQKETGLKIVSIHQYTDADTNFGDIVIEDAGPAEFANLINNADYICTDSFHGSVFSIIFHKKFIVFNRYAATQKVSKNTRIDSLCRNLGLSDRRFSKSISSEIKKDINYNLVEQKIAEMREKSIDYLKDALEL